MAMARGWVGEGLRMSLQAYSITSVLMEQVITCVLTAQATSPDLNYYAKSNNISRY